MAIDATRGQILAPLQALRSALELAIRERPRLGLEERPPPNREGDTSDDDDQQRQKATSRPFPKRVIALP